MGCGARIVTGVGIAGLLASSSAAAPPDVEILTYDRVMGDGVVQIDRAPMTATGEVQFIAELAVDADFEYFQANGMDVDATVAAIEELVSFANTAFEQGPGVTFNVTKILVRTSADDPYTSTNPSTLLAQVIEEWATNQADVPQDVVVLITGKNLDGSAISVSSPNALCTTSSAAIMSPNLLTLPQQQLTLAHGLGHVFGAQHCDGQPDCGIMCSLLFGCNGTGMFGQNSIDAILAFIESFGGCLDETGACPADFNGDGETSILDFISFQAAFSAQQPDADCNEDGDFNVLDFICFQTVFEQGCD